MIKPKINEHTHVMAGGIVTGGAWKAPTIAELLGEISDEDVETQKEFNAELEIVSILHNKFSYGLAPIKLVIEDVVNVKSAFVGATKFVIEISPSAPNSNADPAAFTFNTSPAEPMDERPVPPWATATVSPD